MPNALVATWRDGLIVYFKVYAHREDALSDLGVSEEALEPIAPYRASEVALALSCRPGPRALLLAQSAPRGQSAPSHGKQQSGSSVPGLLVLAHSGCGQAVCARR